jgi:transcriptional regulator with XRE-family HTH domain
MSPREAFGPNLRRLRLERGVSLEEIAQSTKVLVSLWAGLERNDLSRWPSGIYARSYLRDYARAIGADPDSTVDEFCRWFPQGDRRVQKIVQEHAEIVGHTELTWKDDVAPREDRRGLRVVPRPPKSESQGALAAFFLRLRRTFGA